MRLLPRRSPMLTPLPGTVLSRGRPRLGRVGQNRRKRMRGGADCAWLPLGACRTKEIGIVWPGLKADSRGGVVLARRRPSAPLGAGDECGMPDTSVRGLSRRARRARIAGLLLAWQPKSAARSLVAEAPRLVLHARVRVPHEQPLVPRRADGRTTAARGADGRLGSRPRTLQPPHPLGCLRPGRGAGSGVPQTSAALIALYDRGWRRGVRRRGGGSCSAGRSTQAAGPAGRVPVSPPRPDAGPGRPSTPRPSRPPRVW